MSCAASSPPWTIFPRSHERGPIEAWSAGAVLHGVSHDFRARTSAAPLKHGITRLARAVGASHFRARTSAAPLKQPDLKRRPQAPERISALARARPH